MMSKRLEGEEEDGFRKQSPVPRVNETWYYTGRLGKMDEKLVTRDVTACIYLRRHRRQSRIWL